MSDWLSSAPRGTTAPVQFSGASRCRGRSLMLPNCGNSGCCCCSRWHQSTWKTRPWYTMLSLLYSRRSVHHAPLTNQPATLCLSSPSAGIPRLRWWFRCCPRGKRLLELTWLGFHYWALCISRQPVSIIPGLLWQWIASSAMSSL